MLMFIDMGGGGVDEEIAKTVVKISTRQLHLMKLKIKRNGVNVKKQKKRVQGMTQDGSDVKEITASMNDFTISVLV